MHKISDSFGVAATFKRLFGYMTTPKLHRFDEQQLHTVVTVTSADQKGVYSYFLASYIATKHRVIA